MNTAEYQQFMKRLQKWDDEEQYREAIDAIEKLPQEEQTPELVSFLARVYLNMSKPEERHLVKRALELLLSVREEQEHEHSWNYRVGFAYQLLEQEPSALPYFEKALEYREGDEDTIEFIEYCKRCTELPHFKLPFTRRAELCWQAFLKEADKLEEILRGKEKKQEIVEICNKILSVAFDDVDFEMGFNGEKYELILSGNGELAEIFKLNYFKSCAPSEVYEKWNILVGRQSSKNVGDFELRMYGVSLRLSDVRVWPELYENKTLGLSFYSEKLLPLLKEDENKAFGFMCIHLDQAIGEIAAIRYISDIHVLDKPAVGDSFALTELEDYIQENLVPENEKLMDAAEALCNSFTVYQLNPQESEEWNARQDIIVGNTCCVPLVNEFLNGETYTVDSYHNDGIVAGFFFYTLGEMASEQFLDFRDAFVEELEKKVGNTFQFIGGATGTMCGYVDFLAWDFKAFMEVASEFLGNAPVAEAAVQTYRFGNGYFMLKSSKEEE